MADNRKRTLPFRLGLRCLWILATVATLSVGFAGMTRAQECDVGWGLCPDGKCVPLGAECCSSGGYCDAGYHCWSGDTDFCCPDGMWGTRDGFCVPNGISQYCGGGHYCAAGVCCAGGCCNATPRP